MAEPRFEGLTSRECGEHHTVGRRAWCHDCSQYCSYDAPCKGCELPALRDVVAERDRLRLVVERMNPAEGNDERRPLMDDLLAVTRISDPLERARRAQVRLDELQAAVVEMWDIRRLAVVQAANEGMTQREIARQMDVSYQRVGQIMKSYMTPRKRALRERAARRAAENEVVEP